jgi:hypothetical protein
LFQRPETGHLLAQPGDLLLQAVDTRTDRSGWVLAVGGVELMQIAA